MQVDDLIEGYEEFKEKKFKKHQTHYSELVKNGQHPKVLFISCSDSRIIPNMITHSPPGSLFVVRNIGNMVPPFHADEDYHGTAAAIEYAVSILEVTDIIVCGHSHCGAIDGLYLDLNSPNLTHAKKWLELGKPAKDYVEARATVKTNIKKRLELIEKVSVLFQLENLLTYPEVKRKVDEGTLSLRGWYYKIKTGELLHYDDVSHTFVPVANNEDENK